jgi:hypothetical protein
MVVELKRIAVQFLALAEQCTDLLLQRELRKLANEFVDLIERSEQPDGRSH